MPCALIEGGGRVSARRPRHLFFASPKKSAQKKGDPAARVPHRPVGRWGQPAMLGPGVHRGTRCVRPAAKLRSDNRGESVHDARVLRHALTPGPALLGTVRRGWGRAPFVPLLRSARCAVAALGLGRAIAPKLSAARTARVPDTRRSCAAAAVRYPLPTPAGCAEKRRGWGGRVCRRTHTLRDLACRSCLSGVRRTQRVLRHHPRSEHRRLPPFARQGERGTQTGGRLFLAHLLLVTQKKVGAPPGAHPGLRPHTRPTPSKRSDTQKNQNRRAIRTCAIPASS